ncbi:MAG: hypothetical protein ACOVSR_16740 [Bacteroidia bacterium]
MNKKTQLIISTIFHPIFVNIASLWLLFALFPSLAALTYQAKSTIMGVVISLTIVLPSLVVAVLKLTNQVSSIQLTHLKERKWPFAFTALGYIFSFYLLNKAGVSIIILKYLLAGSLTVVCIAIISNFWKISVHMASIGALLSLLVLANYYTHVDLRIAIAIVILIAGLVGSARHFAEAHNIPQLLAGFALGFGSIYLVL